MPGGGTLSTPRAATLCAGSGGYGGGGKAVCEAAADMRWRGASAVNGVMFSFLWFPNALCFLRVVPCAFYGPAEQYSGRYWLV